MHTVIDLLAANLHDVFGSRDPASRRATIARIYTEDVLFTDPEDVSTGWDGLEDKARTLLEKVPADFEFTEDGRLYAGPQDGALAWAFGPAGEPAARGIDIITVRDGRIATLLTILTA
ncbi:nuclear transport factor 2 family protein [Streptomyces sp. NPDC005706]|uniref:nuclear transport factor 2 family protein n=1 Tax=Streptomyces sp. NPDC005706 TaxID=3157169 RepID=UPI0033E28649